MRPIQRLPLDAAATWLLPPTILLFAAGSSSIATLDRIGTPGRWAALLLLALLAVAAAARSGRGVVAPAAWLTGAWLVALAVASAAWSVDARQTLGRAATVALLFVAVAALGVGLPPRRILTAVLVGVAGVAAASALAVLVDRHAAVLSATAGAGWRFRGIGENPNTVSMLLAAGLPLAVWAACTGTGATRVLGALTTFGCAVEIAVSGSRGALVAGCAGALVAAVSLARSWRGRAAAAAAVLAAAALCASATTLQDGRVSDARSAAAPSAPAAPTRGIDAQTVFRLEDELGHPPLGGYRPPVHRTLLGSSGRAEAWSAAAEQGAHRPLLGYGFGSEGRVFVDRSYAFEGGLPENTYLGLFLQLGAIGAATFVVLLALLAFAAARAVRSTARDTAGAAAAATGVLVAAVLIGMTQSGLLAVGNIAALTIWASISTLPILAAEAARR